MALTAAVRAIHFHTDVPLSGAPPQVEAWARSISHHKKFLD
jgi:hypothetical protein